jgi:transposase-like protein
MEIITGVERRRQWRDEEKLRILAALDEPGVKFSAVARRLSSDIRNWTVPTRRIGHRIT